MNRPPVFVRRDNATSALSIKADVSRLRIGVEYSVTERRDENTSNTAFKNFSVNGWFLLVASAAARGINLPVPAH